MGKNKQHDGTVRRDLRGLYKPDGFAVNLLRMTTPEWVPERILHMAEESTRGLTEDMALEVADNVVDAWHFGVLHYTGIPHIDRMLRSLYNRILYAASKQGIRLPRHF